MVGATALQRKILILIYTLWKKDEVFDENYGNNQNDLAVKQEIENQNTMEEKKAGKTISILPAQDELQPSQLMSSYVD